MHNLSIHVVLILAEISQWVEPGFVDWTDDLWFTKSISANGLTLPHW